MIDKEEQYRMVRAPGGIKIGGVEFERPDRDTGLLGLDGRHIKEANRAYVSLPGGGFLNFWGRDTAEPSPRPTGNTYNCLSPFDDHPDATLASVFTLHAHRFDSGVGVTSSMTVDARDRSYGWRIDRLIEDIVTGDFIDSTQPESVESDDGQAGLDDFDDDMTPCAASDVTECDCCRCPECGIRSINARDGKSPTYRCYGQDCGAEFEEPRLRPGQRA